MKTRTPMEMSRRWGSYFLGSFRWFRRWHGGKWAFVFVDLPVGSHMWLPLPPDAGPGYREGLWMGVYEIEDWG